MRNISLLFMLLVACNGAGNKLQRSSMVANNEAHISYSITDDQFIFDAIENDYELNNIVTKCQGYKKKYEIVKNRYSDKMDTLFVFFNNDDTISIYNAGNKKVILNLTLYSKRIGLLKDTVMIGLTKDFFINKYPSIPDNVIFEICNLEGLNCFRFTITNGKLSNIKYQSSYMD